MLIGLVGLIGSGKDTVAERLVSHHGFVRDSFAQSLKDATASIFGWDREMLEGNTESRVLVRMHACRGGECLYVCDIEKNVQEQQDRTQN